MYNELHDHKKSDKVKWIITAVSGILIIAILIGLIVTVFDIKNGKTDKSDEPAVTEQSSAETEPATDNGYHMALHSTQGIKLMSVSPMALNADTQSVSQTITATITPETATNKAVDWSVMWADSSKTETVTEYVTVTPSSDGSTTATVTCYKAFTGDILVVVTTREGGYMADCVVTFDGIPSTIKVTTSEISQSNGYYGLGVGVTYHFKVNQNNVFGVVGDKYKDININVVATGELTMGTYENDPRGSKTWYNTQQKSLSEIMDDILEYSFDGETISVTIKKSIEGYYSSMQRNGSVRTYYDKVKSIDSECYFTFYVNNAKIGVSLQDVFKVNIDPSVVTGVSVTGNISF